MTETLEPHVPKRVLHIGKYFPPHRGGMETVLRDQMNMQTRDEGLQVAAVVHSSERRLTDKVEVQPLGFRVRFAARWFTAIFAPIAPFFAWSVYREIRELDPDEIKIHMPNVSAFWLLGMPAARKTKWTVLWHSDVLPSKHNLGLRLCYHFYKPFEKWLLRRANEVIATSPPYLESSATLRSFREKSRVEPLKIDVARLPKHLCATPSSARERDTVLRILCVGRLTYYKNFSSAIRAVAAIPEAVLRIVGDGDQEVELNQLIEELGVCDRVSLIAEVTDEELWDQYKWCDVHCLPSIERTEALGLSVMEAGIFGKPSVVFNIPGSGVAWNARRSSSYSQIVTEISDQSLKLAFLHYLDRRSGREINNTGAGNNQAEQIQLPPASDTREP